MISALIAFATHALALLLGAALAAKYPTVGERALSFLGGLGARLTRPQALVRPSLPNIPIKLVLGIFLLGLLLWAGFAFRGCAHVPFADLGKSRGEIALERDLSERTREVERETSAAAIDIAAEYERRIGNVSLELERAREALEDSADAENVDFLLAWARADRRLLDAGGVG